jgi:hypothetical protein
MGLTPRGRSHVRRIAGVHAQVWSWIEFRCAALTRSDEEHPPRMTATKYKKWHLVQGVARRRCTGCNAHRGGWGRDSARRRAASTRSVILKPPTPHGALGLKRPARTPESVLWMQKFLRYSWGRPASAWAANIPASDKKAFWGGITSKADIHAILTAIFFSPCLS